MKIEVNSMCRGEGNIYLLVSIDGAVEEAALEPLLTCNGQVLPCVAQTIHFVQGEQKFAVIMTRPAAKAQLDLMVRGKQSGQALGTASKQIDPKAAKFMSALNSRRKENSVVQVRNADSFRVAKKVSISETTLIEYAEAEQWIVRFSVAVPRQQASLIEGCLYAPLSGITVCQKAVLNAVLDDDNVRVVFWAPILKKEPTLCLALRHVQTGEWLDLETFEEGRFADMVNEYFRVHNDAFRDNNYLLSFKRNRASQSQLERQTQLSGGMDTKFSIIVPLYKTPQHFFVDMVQSVIAQSYPNWELVMVNASPEDAQLQRLIDSYCAVEPRLVQVRMQENLGITENTNAGIDAAKGDYICFFDHDDVLEPDILYHYACAIAKDPSTALLYCDEDLLLQNGQLAHPAFKPDFNLDYLRDNNYICHMLTVKADVFSRLVRADKSLDGAQDHSLALQVAELGLPIAHIPRVLYHWRVNNNSTAANTQGKPYATIAGIQAVNNHLDRMGIKAQVQNLNGRPFRYLVSYEPGDDQRLTAVVLYPNSVLPDVANLAKLASEVDAMVVVAPFDIPGVDAETIQVISVDAETGLAEMANKGMQAVNTTDAVIVLGNVCIEGENWKNTLLGHCSRPEVACVGPAVRDVSGMIKEAGVAYSRGSIAALSAGIHFCDWGNISRRLSTQQLSAVGGVCLAIKKQAFDQLGPFDVQLDWNHASVDFCFRASQQGMKIIYTPQVVGTDLDGFYSYDYKPSAAFLTKWTSKLTQVDPFFSPNYASTEWGISQYLLERTV